jgi:hypothetical protein
VRGQLLRDPSGEPLLRGFGCRKGAQVGSCVSCVSEVMAGFVATPLCVSQHGSTQQSAVRTSPTPVQELPT